MALADLKGAWLMAKESALIMKANEDGGSIINIVSILGVRPYPWPAEGGRDQWREGLRRARRQALGVEGAHPNPSSDPPTTLTRLPDHSASKAQTLTPTLIPPSVLIGQAAGVFRVQGGADTSDPHCRARMGPVGDSSEQPGSGVRPRRAQRHAIQ